MNRVIKIDYSVLCWFRIPIAINTLCFLLCGIFQLYTTSRIVGYINDDTATCGTWKGRAYFNYFIGSMTLLMALGLIVFYFFLHKWSRQTTLYQTLDEDNNNDNNQSLDDQSLSHPTPQGAPVNTPPRTSRPETYTEMTSEEILEYSKTPISFLIIGAFVVIYATAVGMTWGIPSPACIRPDERVVSVLLSGSCLATMLCLPFLIYIFVDEENNSYMESICCPHAAPWLWMIVPLIIIATPIFLPFSFFLLGWLIYKRVTYRRNN